MGLLGRFTHLITLPPGWAWLENGWVIGIVAVLLLVEIVADKIPALDSINDTVQTFVRPTAGGIVVFGSGTAAQTAAVTDPGEFARTGQWVPIAIGVVTALVVHLTKTAVRPAATSPPRGGRAGAEHDRGRHQCGTGVHRDPDPALVLVILLALAWAAVSLLRRRRRRKAARADTNAPGTPPGTN